MLLPAGALDLIHHNLPADLVSIILAKADDAHFADLVAHQSFASNSRDVSIPDMLRESNKRLIEPWIIQVPCLKQRRDKSNVEYNSIPITAADILQCVLHHNSGLPVILKDTRKVFASESDILHFEVHLSKWGYQGSPLAFTVATESIAKGLLRRYDKPAYHFCKESHDFLDVEEGSFAFIALGYVL